MLLVGYGEDLSKYPMARRTEYPILVRSHYFLVSGAGWLGLFGSYVMCFGGVWYLNVLELCYHNIILLLVRKGYSIICRIILH